MLFSVLANFAAASGQFPCASVKECAGTTFWHIPGPNPIVAPGPDSKGWESKECEVAGGVFKANSTYYFIYHCLSDHNSYRVGISTATSPMGPWTMPPPKPNLDVTANAWDQDTVASFNILPNPHPKDASEAWLGYYEGGMQKAANGKWSLGVATAPAPEGPWTKSVHNPILPGSKVCDNNRTFTPGVCNGLYVASVMYGPHTDNEFWLYMEAPINENDEGPIALWTAKQATGPFTFKAYVLDGGNRGGWDSGRYSESRVTYHNGLFHLFATGSFHGSPHPDKVNEQIGYAVSADGVTFVEHPSNPLVPFEQTTPHTQALAEGHVWFEDAQQLVYVFHTLRWDTEKDVFASNGRNAEDLGVELLSPSPKLDLSLPVITTNWRLDLGASEESPCAYNWATYRYCANLKTVIGSASSPMVLVPALAFAVRGSCSSGKSVSLTVKVKSFTYAGGVGATVKTFDLKAECSGAKFVATTPPTRFDVSNDLPEPWVVATVTAASESKAVTMDVSYSHSGELSIPHPYYRKWATSQT